MGRPWPSLYLFFSSALQGVQGSHYSNSLLWDSTHFLKHWARCVHPIPRHSTEQVWRREPLPLRPPHCAGQGTGKPLSGVRFRAVQQCPLSAPESSPSQSRGGSRGFRRGSQPTQGGCRPGSCLQRGPGRPRCCCRHPWRAEASGWEGRRWAGLRPCARWCGAPPAVSSPRASGASSAAAPTAPGAGAGGGGLGRSHPPRVPCLPALKGHKVPWV